MAKRKIAVIDCETDPFRKKRIPKPFIWGFYDGVEYVEFSDHHALLDYVREKPLIIYAHNGGKFDYMFMLDELEPFDDIMIISGRLAKFKIGICEFRDSFNIIPVGLGKFQKMEFDYSLLEESERSKPENFSKIREYLKSDCVNLYEMVSAFVEEYGMNLTQAGTAMKRWAKMSNRKPPRTDQEFYGEFSQFYYGGRVQCFQTGVIETPFRVADINSAYPFAMLHEHPISNDYFYEESHRPNNLTGDLFCIVKARSRGALPFRDEKGALTFPDDGIQRLYAVTGWEILAGERTATLEVDEWVRVYSFNELISFREYIEYFYEKRLKAKAEKDKANDLFAKLLMNSLYGKFGANPDDYKKYTVIPMRHAATIAQGGVYEYAGELGPWGLAQRDLDTDEMRYYNVATAASITGFVRAMLWESICKCGGVLYCDTDSIAAEDISALGEGSRLGEWKDEGLYHRAGIGGKKLYIFESDNGDKKKASKGAKLTDAELWKVAAGEMVEYEPEAPTFSVFHEPRFINRRIRRTG